MYCARCGAENPDGAQICSSCSAVLSAATPQGPAVPVKTSGLAIASLVLGILSPFTCFLTALPGIILGIVALVKIQTSAGQLKGTGWAVAGIAIPPAVLPIAACLAAMLMPALARTRCVARRIACGNNMRGVAMAMVVYADEHDGMLPTPSRWCDLLVNKNKVDKKTLKCPGAKRGPCSYAMNKNVLEFGADSPGDVVLLFETSPGWNQSGGPELLTTENHERQGCNVVFVDSHVEFVRAEKLKLLRWKP